MNMSYDRKMDRRSFLSDYVGKPVVVATVSSLVSPLEALAQDLTIADFYRQSRRADNIMPGLREQNFGYARVTTPGFSIRASDFIEKYGDRRNGRELREIFGSLNDRRVSVRGIASHFDFNRFDRYWRESGSEAAYVHFQGGIMSWNVPNSRVIYSIPIGTNVADRVRTYSNRYNIPTL